MKILMYVGIILLAMWFTWGIYLTIMHLKTARDSGKLTPAAKIFAYPWAVLFLFMDVAFNLVVGTIIFLEPPREWLFTARVSRLNDGDDWRGKLATFLCTQLLDPFDPDGRHCS